MTPAKSIIVTGGASGIGLGIIRYLLTESNAHVCILDISPAAGAQSVKDLQAEFPLASITFEECDVSSWESQAAAFEKIYAQEGRIDVVFANAGITEKGSLLPPKGTSDGEKGRPVKPNLATINVNLVGVIYSVQLAVHYISKNTVTESNHLSKGLIVCTASDAGIYPLAIAPMYSASKHGIIGLVRSLARPLLKEQIRINALAPGVIETSLAGNAALFKAMTLTPMSTAQKAVAKLMADPSLTGKVAELQGEQVNFAEPPSYMDEEKKANFETFWELGYA